MRPVDAAIERKWLQAALQNALNKRATGGPYYDI